jgi:hypothetical protein
MTILSFLQLKLKSSKMNADNMTQGTPISRDVAIFAAQLMYDLPAEP